MVYSSSSSYTPTYYSSVHDKITSLCKTILPFSSSLKKRRLLSKQQSENLKWQQDSFHRILNLIGLQNEGIVQEMEVSVFRSQLLDTLIASPPHQEEPTIIRDKLLYLQELFYAKCISEDEYHSSKRPLLQRLAVQGAEIEARDVIVATASSIQPPQIEKKTSKEEEEEVWSDIDFKDEECLMRKENLSSNTNKHRRSPLKPRIKGGGGGGLGGGTSIIKLVWPSYTSTDKNKGEKKESNQVEVEQNGVSLKEKVEEEEKEDNAFWDKEEKAEKPMMMKKKKKKKQWGFDVGFKKWKKGTNLEEGEDVDNEGCKTTPPPPSCRIVSRPIEEGPDTKQIKRKMHSDGSASDFFIDKVLGDNIKKELSRIQTELSTTNPNHLCFSNDQIDAISTRLPVDKADLKNYFPKSWCDRYGDIVVDVVRKKFKEHEGEMESLRNNTNATATWRGDSEMNTNKNSSSRWVTFEDADADDDGTNNTENYHPNLFASSSVNHHSFFFW